MEILFNGQGHPMIATHDLALVAEATATASGLGRSRESWELQMLYGIRPEEQQSLSAAGVDVRVYLPFGTDWYGYYIRRLAERPANLLFLLRNL